MQLEKEQNNRANQKQNSVSKGKSLYKKRKPVKESYWDDDGILLDTHQNSPSQKTGKKDDAISKKSYLNPRSIAILVSSRPTLNRSIMETAEQSPKSTKLAETQKSQRKRAPSVQESKANFNKFIERQRESAEKRVLSENNVNESNQEEKFLSKESKMILKRANKQNSSILADSQRRKKKPHQPEEEYSFHPDLSLTLNSKNVTGLSLKYSEAKAVIKDIQLTAIKVEQEAIDMKDCTYKPDLISNPKARAKANREKVNQRKRERNKELAKYAYKDEDDKECKQVKFCKKIPSRTQELNDMLKVFRNAGKDDDDDDEDES